MKKTGKLLALILSAAMAALTACSGGGSSGQGGDAPAAPKDNNTIEVFGSVRSYPGQEEAYQKMFDAFTAETGIRVHARWQGGWDEIPQNLSAAKMSGEQIDLVYVSPTYLSDLAKSGMLLDMTELMKPLADRFNGNVTDAYSIGGKTWGFPYGSSGTSLVYYNKTMFDELGIAEPKTFDELVAAGKKLAGEKGVMPIIQQGKSPSYWPMWFFETYAQTSGNQSVEKTTEFLSGKASFDNAETIAAMDALKAFFDNGLLTSASLETDSDGMRASFATQKAAMFYSGAWDYPTITEMVTDFEVGVMEFPLITSDPNVKSQHGGGVDDGYGIPVTCNQDNLENIMKLIEFMTRPENANAIISTYSPLISTLKGVEVADTDVVKKINAEIVPNTISFLDWIWPAEVTDAVAQAVPAVVSGYTTSAEAVKTVQQAYETIVKEKNYSYDWWAAWTEEDWAKVTPKSVPDPTK